MYARRLVEDFTLAAQQEAVILLTGARQSGKTTLMQQLLDLGTAKHYVTMDDEFERARALSEPQNYVLDLLPGTVIDEVQRVPELFLPIKLAVDRARQPGQFFLTGSADVLFVPQAADALVGRMRSLTLWPLSQGEIDGVHEGFIEQAFSGEFKQLDHLESRTETIERALRGGFPEVIRRLPVDRSRWLSDYASDVLQRDVRELANVERLRDLPQILHLCATRAGSTVNRADYARGLGIPQPTLDRYLSLLERVFLVHRLPAWYRNIGQRLVKAPKLLFGDSGLMGALLGVDSAEQLPSSGHLGPLIENFVGSELLKQIGFYKERPVTLHHYRTHKGVEIDYVLENRAGAVVGVEVKAAETFGQSDFSGLEHLRNSIDDFACGVLLYGGSEIRKIKDRIWALPIPALWISDSQ